MCNIKQNIKDAINEVITSEEFKNLLSDTFTLLDDARTKELTALREKNNKLEKLIHLLLK